jgi:hypothetical protein
MRWVSLSLDLHAMILIAWFQRRAGRSISVTMFDDEFDLQTAKDFESFVEKIKRVHGDQISKV